MKEKDPLLKRRIILALVGMLLAGISVGIFKRAFFGVDPFQCFCNGWAQVVPIGFGTLYMLINAVLLVIDLFLDRHYIGISTFLIFCWDILGCAPPCACAANLSSIELNQ